MKISADRPEQTLEAWSDSVNRGPRVGRDLLGRNRWVLFSLLVTESHQQAQLGFLGPCQTAWTCLTVGDEDQRVFGKRCFGALEEREWHGIVPAE